MLSWCLCFRLVDIACDGVSLRCCVHIYYTYMFINSLLIYLMLAFACFYRTAGPCVARVCLLYTYIFSLIVFDDGKKNIEQTNLKKKNPTWVFWDGKNWQKSNEMKIYGWYKKQNKWIFFFIVYFFIKWFVELKEKLILVLWLVRCCK